ncbi:MAG: methyltransferase [Actinobacteria bacterium HGW-Actinobacteria-10]|jgi:SAM-dependent methyltransferase|nr:MAG: methyltransferase [Actinobacteria bacterium HGW-Actinobacteria-10]
MASAIRNAAKNVVRRLLSPGRTTAAPPRAGTLDLGDLARTTPISRVFGCDRGTPVDRYYIERFLAANSEAIRGRVLEIGDRTYTERFGGAAVDHSDVLHVTGDSPEATIVADLTCAPQIADATFDCIVLTQTLHFTYAMEAAVSELHRILKPGGSVLCTVPGISQISRYDMDRWGDYWRLTDLSARALFETAFAPANVRVETYGNVFSAVALLHGLVLDELDEIDLDVHDNDYQVIVAIQAARARD